MAFIHNTNSNEDSKRRNGKYEPIYASSASLVSLFKDKMPDKQQDPQTIYNLIKDELLLDGNAKQNLATFCQTWLSPQIHKVMDLCIDKNMIDKDEYPQTAEIENRCVHILAKLWNSPSAAETIGCSTVGSSEAAMLGGLAMKWQWRKRREKEGKSTSRPNLICGAVQVCCHKFARYFDVELREIPITEDKISMQPEDVIKYCDENTIGIVPTLGVTFTCMFEDVQAISKALDKLQKEKGWDIPIHVDAASGGFIAPFVYPNLIWDFRLKRVKSINASGHKYGLSPLGVGWVIWREKQDLPEDLVFTVDYLGGNMPTFALNFSRPGGQVIVQYYNFMRLGMEGYRNITQACMEHSIYIGEEIKKIKIHGKSLFKLFYDGKGGLPAVSWRLNPDIKVNFTLYDLSERLRLRGWQVPAYPLPPKLNNVIIQRILVRQGFSKDMADLLLDDFRAAIEQCIKHPIEVSAKKTPFSHI